MNSQLLERYDLNHLAEWLTRFEKKAIAFSLTKSLETEATRSKLGGLPLLPPDFIWPRNKLRTLDFLLQIDLAEVAQFDPTGALPASGLLTFFYDLENQPWGFDPAELDGFRVELFGDDSLVSCELPSPEYVLSEHSLTFSPSSTLPHYGSRAYDQLERQSQMSDLDAERYFDFLDAYESRFYPIGSGLNRMFGHSANVQGDMQLEAQLVTHGLYCGDSSGYEDVRARKLKHGADNWILLLQLDSDEKADLMWGDAGMLYYWIRSDDLAAKRFDRVWMSLQCG